MSLAIMLEHATDLLTDPLSTADRSTVERLQAQIRGELHAMAAFAPLDTEQEQLFDKGKEALTMLIEMQHTLEASTQYASNERIKRTVLGMLPTDPRVSQWPPALRLPGAEGHGKTMARLFGAVREGHPWKSMEEYFLAVMTGRSDSRLINVQAAMSEGDFTHGGFLVPGEFAYAVLDAALHASVVASRADVTPMLSRTKLVAAYDAMDQSVLNQMYGVDFRWLEESEDVVPSKAKTRAILLTAWTAGAYVAASNELVMDAPDFAENLSARILVNVSENLDDIYLNGDGIAKPLGVLNAPGLLVVPKEGTQAAGTVTLGNLATMLSRTTSFTTCVWVINPSLIPVLKTMKVDAGPGANLVNPLETGPDGSMTMLTRPVVVSSKLPVLGQQGDILLACFDQYYVGLRQQVSLELSTHVGFLRNESNWRAIVRTDGQPKANKVYIGPDGLSYSPFVTLGARL